MSVKDLYPRHIRPRMMDALADTPVLLIHGPHQCGKTTLSRLVGDEQGFDFFTFDNEQQLAMARADPKGYVSDLPERAVLDEVQRVPGLFISLKLSVDTHRKPGRFILTGSANVLLVPKLSDSLAGRMEILRLHPLSQAEIARAEPNFLSALFGGAFKSGTSGRRLGRGLAERMVAGGYPKALMSKDVRRRTAWYKNYANTLIQRDIRELARVQELEILQHLLKLYASETACPVNVSSVAKHFTVSQETIKRYIRLLSQIFLLEKLPSWHKNRSHRGRKASKLHFGDTGLACSLLSLSAQRLWNDRKVYGRMLETFVYQELRRQASWSEEHVSFSHFREKDGAEVDVVLECAGSVVGIEVKATSVVNDADFKGLRRFQEENKKAFAAGSKDVIVGQMDFKFQEENKKTSFTGVVLYDGDVVLSFGEGLYGVPISHLWERDRG